MTGSEQPDGGVDRLAPDDEYYPTIRYLCRNCAGGDGR